MKIHRDGDVTFGVHRAEMGQGVTTALPMLLAEELDVDWERVRFEFTPVDRDYYNFGLLLRGRPLGDTAGRPMAQAGERLIRGAVPRARHVDDRQQHQHRRRLGHAAAGRRRGAGAAAGRRRAPLGRAGRAGCETAARPGGRPGIGPQRELWRARADAAPRDGAG